MRQRDYDSTVARMAGNILSGSGDVLDQDEYYDDERVARAVKLARAIIEETRATEAIPVSPPNTSSSSR